MSPEADQSPQQQQQAQEQAQEVSLLDRVLQQSEQEGVKRDRAQEWVQAIVDEVSDKRFEFDKNVSKSLKDAIARMDDAISKQLAAIMHHEKFQKLEGTWRGLHYLISNSELGSDANMYVDVLNVTKKDLVKDFERSTDFDQSTLFTKIYEDEYGTPGGQPYGAMIGDFEFTTHPEDMELLRQLAGVAATSFCPFLSAASPQLFGLKSYTDMPKIRDLKDIFGATDYVQWRSFRESEDSRFVTLTMPRALARLPYGSNTKTIEEFAYEEVPIDEKGKNKVVPAEQYCWMNSAYVLGTRLTDAFAKTGFCTAIRGAKGGGKVENLPVHTFLTDDGDVDMNCPSEIAITDRREKELSDAGFLPLCHYKNTDYSVFFGAQSTQKPKEYDNDNATANAKICARLPYVMATARFCHYIKVIGRDMVGSLKEASDVEEFLLQWIAMYVLKDEKPTDEMKAKYPLREAKIEVKEDPRSPGSYHAVAWLRPWLQMEELNASVRMVARIPAKK